MADRSPEEVQQCIAAYHAAEAEDPPDIHESPRSETETLTTNELNFAAIGGLDWFNDEYRDGLKYEMDYHHLAPAPPEAKAAT
jgi:hypothetical protein